SAKSIAQDWNMLCGPREPFDYPVDRLVFRPFASRSLDHRTSWKVPGIVASCRIAICLGHLNHRITSHYAAAHEQNGSAAKPRDLSFLQPERRSADAVGQPNGTDRRRGPQRAGDLASVVCGRASDAQPLN